MWGYDSDNYLSHSGSRGYEETFELVDVYDDNGDLIAFKIKTVGHEDHDDGEPVLEYYLTVGDDSGTVYAADETSSLTEAQSWKIYSVDEDSFAIGISKPLAANETIKVLTMNPNVNGNGYYYSVAPYTGSNNQRWYVYSADQQLYRDSMNLRDGSYVYRVHTEGTLHLFYPISNYDYKTVSFERLSGNSYSIPYRYFGDSLSNTKSGSTVIQCNIYDENEERCDYFNKNLYITKAFGLYKFKNVARSNFYIELNNGSVEEGINYIQWPVENNRNSIFKVTHLGNGIYSIRSMVKSDMGLWANYSGGTYYLLNKTIGTYDSKNSIDQAAQWKIEASANGYMLVNVKYPNYNVSVPTSTAQRESIELRTYSGTMQEWTMTKINVSYNGITILEIPEYIGIQDSFTFSSACYSSELGNNHQSVTWSTSNSYIASISDAGVVNANNLGEVTITAIGPKSVRKSIEIEVEPAIVVVPCAYARNSNYPNVHSFTVYLKNFLNEYDTLISNATWTAFDNGVITYNISTPNNLNSMTVTGIGTGVAWLEATKNGNVVLICYVYVENVLESFPQRLSDYLYLDGTFLGTISCQKYQLDHKLDPLIMRIEWYLLAVKMDTDGYSEEEIRSALDEECDLYTDSLTSWQYLYAEIIFGSRGGYARENLRLSFDGLRFLLNFYTFQFAAYEIMMMDQVNVFTPATTEDVLIEKEYARKLCMQTREGAQQIDDNLQGISFSNKTMTTAAQRNATWAARGYTNPPYKSNTAVYKITLEEDTTFVRVYDGSISQKNGSWIMKSSDIDGLSAVEIKNKYSLPAVPNYKCTVSVQAGIDIYVGIAGPIDSMTGSGIQYDLDYQALPGIIFGLEQNLN